MTFVSTALDQAPQIEKHRKSFLKRLVVALFSFTGKATAKNLAKHEVERFLTDSGFDPSHPKFKPAFQNLASF